MHGWTCERRFWMQRCNGSLKILQTFGHCPVTLLMNRFLILTITIPTLCTLKCAFYCFTSFTLLHFSPISSSTFTCTFSWRPYQTYRFDWFLRLIQINHAALDEPRSGDSIESFLLHFPGEFHCSHFWEQMCVIQFYSIIDAPLYEWQYIIKWFKLKKLSVKIVHIA